MRANRGTLYQVMLEKVSFDLVKVVEKYNSSLTIVDNEEVLTQEP